MYSGPLRRARALILSATCLALSLAGHLAGGGRPPTAGNAAVSLLVLLALAVPLSLALQAASRHRWTFGRAMVALGVSQLVLHLVLTMLLGADGDTADASATPGMVGQPGMVGMPGMGSTSVAGGAGSMGGAGHHGLAMTLGHTAAALLVAVAVSRADTHLAASQALSRAVAALSGVAAAWRVVGVLPAPLPPAGGLQGAVRGARWPRPRILTDLVVLQCLSRRGPPVPA